MPAVLATRCRWHTNHEHLGFVLAEKSRLRAAGIANEFYRPIEPPARNVDTVKPPVTWWMWRRTRRWLR